MRDLPQLKASFAELGVKGWQNLVDGKSSEHAELAQRAWRIYIADYGLDDDETTEASIPPKAAAEYMAALHAGRVPEWVQDLALLGDISQAAKGVNQT